MRSFHRQFASRVALFLVLCGIVALAPRAAFAHALLVSSTPKAGSTVTGPDLDIVLKYDSRVDPARSSVSLLAPDGKVRELVIAHPQSGPQFLSTKATGLAKGAYVLRWTALSSDGHITRGEVPFTVR
jgi:copper resistance protein C